MNTRHQRSFQFGLMELLVVVTIIAAGVGLWRYETQVNPDRLGQGGVLLQLVRITWNLIFSANLCLIGWVYWRARDGALERRQWRLLVMLSSPPLAFFLLILVGMSWGADSFDTWRGGFALTWCLSALAWCMLVFGLTVQAASLPHRILHLVAVASATLTVFAACCV